MREKLQVARLPYRKHKRFCDLHLVAGFEGPVMSHGVLMLRHERRQKEPKKTLDKYVNFDDTVRTDSYVK
jgi:hypothetical protein